MNIHESAEDYLESILVLKKRLGQVRSIDIVNELNYSKPSVSVAMKKLRENGYIEMDAGGYITLLPTGQEIAERIFVRHSFLTSFFEHLGVDADTAAADACRIEHYLSDQTFEKLCEHAQQIIDGKQ